MTFVWVRVLTVLTYEGRIYRDESRSRQGQIIKGLISQGQEFGICFEDDKDNRST